MADYYGFRAAELGSIMGEFRDAIAVGDIGAQVQEDYRCGLGQVQTLMDRGSPVLPIVNLHEHPEIQQVAGLDVDILERLAFRERQHGRSILNPDYFIASRVEFK
ncbi:hypothetical protein E8E14_000604 [Neopestalotiopsis sp. 37M]|nr:hypothetical protein E8E14_000604 [Neopestalotiopsis sp. 37M]